MLGKVKQSALFFLAMISFGGCNNDSAQTGSEKRSDITVHQTEKSSNVEAVRHGKPGAQVSLLENKIYYLQPGVDTEIVIVLSAPYTSGEMSVEVRPSEGLAIVDGATDHSFAFEQGRGYQIPLGLVAAEPGRYYVNLQVAVTREGLQSFRSISAIVQVGSENRQKRAEEPRDKASSSDDVISLPAQEVIIRE